MSSQSINGAKRPEKKTRRSKKRRTADFSDSDSDSDSRSSSEPQQGNKELAIEKELEDASDVELSDAEAVPEEAKFMDLDAEVKQKLNDIPLTRTEAVTSRQKNLNRVDLDRAQEKIDAGRAELGLEQKENELKNEYLGLLFKHYGEEVSSLREAPDFTPKSLVTMANVLKDGALMFDIDALKTVLESEK
ncbi:LAMI_0B05556g1_1 [Lachancea mirantina]|uniref:Ribosome assembly protein 3 n=1 Tax=Lachancea mirantina TaxID=1230905 RepID=A0A1G4IWE3_9SACH|nr:LAMI_0B05556g1_1 [Lachancea mirantina]